MKTITTKEIYYAAMYHIMEKREHEEMINERTYNDLGRYNEISQHRIKKYSEQIDELHAAILEIEKQETAN